MKRWACFSIFKVKVAILAPSIALFGIILFLSYNKKKQTKLLHNNFKHLTFAVYYFTNTLKHRKE